MQSPSPRLKSQNFSYAEKCFTKFLEICMDLYGGRKPTETYAYATEVCYKSVNLSLGELKNIKITLFLIPELLR